MIKLLGIETSCDETAAAVVQEDGKILSNLVLSQLKDHKAFGGVVPEIAARAHMEHLDTLIKGAMDEADLAFKDLDGVAATSGPGLIGGVMVGMIAGKAIAAAYDLPFVGVNHLEAHVLTARLTHNISFPYLVLLVSGGHTQILVAEDVGVYKRWGTTIDDALGECFDKSAKLMGLPYPGGPNLEKMAARCEDPITARMRFPLPAPMKGRAGCDFSFSGLKTAVRNHVEKLPPGDLNPKDIADLASAFQQTVAESVIDRCFNSIKQFQATYPQPYSRSEKVPAFVVCGGVAANKPLRAALQDLTTALKMDFIAPPLALCSDNGAMIAWTGIERVKRDMTDTLDIPAFAKMAARPNSGKTSWRRR